MISGSVNIPFAEEELSNVVVLKNGLNSAVSTSSNESYPDNKSSNESVKLKFQIESNDESSNER